MTPHELIIYARAYQERIELEHEEVIVGAYLTAMWAAQWIAGKKKPDSLDKILKKRNKRERMSDEEMYRKVIVLHKAFGGE